MTLAAVLADCERSEYERKMIHDVPDAPSVDRMEFLRERCEGKVVLDIGHSGPAGELIDRVAKKVISVNKEPPADIAIDLDGNADVVAGMLRMRWCEVAVCAEVLEHLANPGALLRILRNLRTRPPVIITVPNAFGRGHQHWMKNRQEMVNCDHVAWYSYHTLKTLVERYGFTVSEFYWYNGPPLVAEGLIFVVE